MGPPLLPSSPTKAASLTKLQAAVLADLRLFDKSRLRPTFTPVPKECRSPCQEAAGDAELSQQRAALQKLVAIRRFAQEDKAPCQVLDKLFIGSIGAARNLEALQRCGVTHVLNASQIVPCFHKGKLRYKIVPVFDDDNADIAQHFADACRFMKKGRRKGGVLVHCYAGQSRSATLVLAYLVACEDMTLSAALQLLKSVRPVVRPNSGFMRQLCEFAQELGRSDATDVAGHV